MTAENAMRHTALRWPRFLALVRVDLAERWRGYAGFLLIALLIQVLGMALLLSLGSPARPMDLDSQMGWYYGYLLVYLAAFACLLYAPMEKQGASLLMLMRPASVLEKWLHAMLMLLVLFPLAYTVVYLLVTVPVNAVAAGMEAARLGQNPVGFHVFLPLMSLQSGQRDMWAGQVFFIWWYLVISGFGSFALVRFRRAAAIKALGLALAVFMLTMLLLAWGHGGGGGQLFEWLQPQERASMDLAGVLGSLLFWLLAPALCWLAGYFALRERDLA